MPEGQPTHTLNNVQGVFLCGKCKNERVGDKWTPQMSTSDPCSGCQKLPGES